MPEGLDEKGNLPRSAGQREVRDGSSAFNNFDYFAPGDTFINPNATVGQLIRMVAFMLYRDPLIE